MARDSDSIFNSDDIWALTGEKNAPSFPINSGWGSVYSTTELPSRETFNYWFYRLSLLAEQINAYGGNLIWDTSIPYKQSAVVIGSDNLRYEATTNNSAVDPVGDLTGTWILSDISALATYMNTSGQVKVNDGNSIKPTVSHTTVGAGTPTAEQDFIYVSPVGISTSPTTHYPLGEADKNETSMFDFTNGTFLEYRSLGSQNEFRLIITWNKPGSLTSKFYIRVRLYNPNSLFTQSQEKYVSEETTSGEVTFNFLTIADSASLPSPLGTGNGYKITTSIIGDNGSECDITLDNFVRFNYPNSYIAP